MRYKRIKKYVLLLITIWLTLLSNFSAVEAAKIYHPYPIIFVHGIDLGDWGTFGFTRHRFNDYFYNVLAVKPEEKYKYFHTSEEGYFPKCDYGSQNNGDIPTIARTTLQQAIISALSSYPPEVPEDDRKVIIVAHSMGGLVVRSFLQQFPSYKELGIIDKVIFLGTPHLGTPSASAGWSLNKVYREVLDPMVEEYAKFYSQNVGGRRVFADESSNMIVDGLIYDELSTEIQKYKKVLKRDLDLTNLGGPDPNGIALEQLRLAGNVRYYKVFESAYKNKKQNITIDLSIDGTNTFLGQSSLYLSNPSNYFTVVGDYQGGDINIPARWINRLRLRYEPDFTYFPAFNGVVQSVSNAIADGDGVVTTQSQLGIDGEYTTISVYHTDEPNAWDTILQAIDDAPVIESVRFVLTGKRVPLEHDGVVFNEYAPWYAIFKVKDYLLADIEISDFRLGQFLSVVDLTEFHDLTTDTYKPYVKFGKEFLKEREDKNAPVIDKDGNVTYLHLMPGEFYVKINFLKTGFIKIKNPAQKEAGCEISYLFSPLAAIVGGEGQEYKVVIDNDNRITYATVRAQAYNNFLANKGISFTYNDYLGTEVGAGGGHLVDSFTDEHGIKHRRDIFYAGISRGDLRIKFDPPNIGSNKRVKSAVLYGRVLKPIPAPSYYDLGPDFNILVYHDPSNAWPPTSEYDFTGGNFLFSLNAADYKNNDIFAVEINPAEINLYEANVWLSRPDFMEGNYIPIEENKTVLREMLLGNIELIVVVEDKPSDNASP